MESRKIREKDVECVRIRIADDVHIGQLCKWLQGRDLEYSLVRSMEHLLEYLRVVL